MPEGLRDLLEALFSEVPVEGEGSSQPRTAHGLEANAVNQREFLPSCCEKGRHRRFVVLLSDPEDPEQRDEVLLQCPHGFQSQTVLKERKRLDQNIVGRDQILLPVRERPPGLGSAAVLLVVGVEIGVEVRGVQEDTLFLKASSR
jgi:hypothetical protein